MTDLDELYEDLDFEDPVIEMYEVYDAELDEMVEIGVKHRAQFIDPETMEPFEDEPLTGGPSNLAKEYTDIRLLDSGEEGERGNRFFTRYFLSCRYGHDVKTNIYTYEDGELRYVSEL